MDGFAKHTVSWFSSSFASPTEAQIRTWPAIIAGDNVLLSAPTGSGKTLAAFLAAIDRIGSVPIEQRTGTSVLYISPLRALAVDVEKNLRSPIVGIGHAANRLGTTFEAPSVGIRTGDSSPEERRRLVRHPPDILVTTPESMYLMLTSAARSTLATVTTVIIDEIHAVAATKRGAHLSVSLERLEALIHGAAEADAETGALSSGHRPSFQRIGLSATQRPIEAIGRFLGGFVPRTNAESALERPVTIVRADGNKTWDLHVEFGAAEPVGPLSVAGDGERPARSSWPQIHDRLLGLVEDHNSTLMFVNDRRSAERLSSKLNELHAERIDAAAADLGRIDAGTPGDPQPRQPHLRTATGSASDLTVPSDDGRPVFELVKAHHGSLSRERRLMVEDELKRGELAGLVATSSLELGIDMGAVDLVVQVGSPRSVAAGLQRVGRAGHQVGAASRGRFFPKFSADLLETAAVVERMLSGELEHTAIVRNPLDVLAQQIVAAVAMDDWTVDELWGLTRRSANFLDISREQFANVVDMLSGRYPSEEFTELRARINWDRTTDVLSARKGSQRLAVTNPGTIPDRGLFGVFLPDGTRVGELDEEMVYEARPSETFMLGATTWQIEDIGADRVTVTPASGRVGRLPFWRGEGPGRPLELGRAVGSLTRELLALDPVAARQRLVDRNKLSERAADHLMVYLDEQREHTTAVPDDRTIVIERFPDEIGDWRICILTPFGNRVHAPWGTLLRHRLNERWPVGDSGSTRVEVLWSDDGIVIRLPEAIDSLDLDDLLFQPETLRDELIAAVSTTSLFAGRFRESAARALLLPRRRPGHRSPLWQQRQRSSDLLSVASKYPQFPILLEATRECLEDHFDVDGLVELMSDVSMRRVRMVAVDSAFASPFARSLLFDWIAIYMYEGDTPLAERRAAALSLDRSLLNDLLGSAELRSLLDGDVIAAVHAEHQRLVERRWARDVDDVIDILRQLGPMARHELDLRSSIDGFDDVLDSAMTDRRVVQWGTTSTSSWYAAVEDAGRVRDAFGVALVAGLPHVCTEPTENPVGELVLRLMLNSGPLTLDSIVERVPARASLVLNALESCVEHGLLVSGEFSPGVADLEWCSPAILGEIRRRTLAVLRSEIEPVEQVALARFVQEYQGIGPFARRGIGALEEVIGQLEGVAVAASALERTILPNRVRDYAPYMLDQLFADGELMWLGAGPRGASDGWVRLVYRDSLRSGSSAGLLLSRPSPLERIESQTDERAEPVHEAIINAIRAGRALRWDEIVEDCRNAAVEAPAAELVSALWDLVWRGELSNDSFAAVRSFVASGRSRTKAPAATAPRMVRRSMRGRSPREPRTAGRWWSTDSLIRGHDDHTTGLVASVERSLDLYGVLTREIVNTGAVTGGFSSVYPVLRTMEERGRIRRGYFVSGLGAAQFARDGAAERLRAINADLSEGVDEPVVAVVDSTDPSALWGSVLEWPQALAAGWKPTRAPGNLVITRGAAPVAYVDRKGRKIWMFDSWADGVDDWVITLLAHWQRTGRRRVELWAADDGPVQAHPVGEILARYGFVPSYRGMVLSGT